jgi:hypothetical protein
LEQKPLTPLLLQAFSSSFPSWLLRGIIKAVNHSILLELTTVATNVYKHVKGSVPPELLKKLKESPEKEFRIILQPEYEVDEDMPPEEMFSEESIESVKESEAAYKAGDCSKAETAEELQASLKKLWNE